ncbi:hypothetical protein [Methylohalobius crimeensis]|uniref:hypothetical protein n=1 Tax=Methylohalobius crimeensis TaxID=244365 RepID=UPI0003B47B5E|nr:hypothetical protein [Methylohalobius crimeensis]
MTAVVLGGPLTTKRTDQYGGGNRIHGTVRVESTPAETKRVLLLNQRSFQVVAETFTAPDGTYAFEHIAAGMYLVAGQDLQTNFHPDIARVESEPMP